MVYNRPQLTKKIFRCIQAVKPKHLFIAADGPSKNDNRDVDLCQQTRQIKDMIDWDCRVEILFQDKHLGCKKAITSAIDWFFKAVDAGIILEDDCMPHVSFFPFCEQLLEYYKDDERVGAISGSHPFDDRISVNESYFFSNYNRIWGWATWARAWRKNDPDIRYWPELKKKKIHYGFFSGKAEVKKWEKIWDKCYRKEIDTWDYQWYLAKRKESMLTAVSCENSVTNVGFGKDSTHTSNILSDVSMRPACEIAFPLKHPSHVVCYFAKDEYISRNYGGGLLSKILCFLLRKIKKEF